MLSVRRVSSILLFVYCSVDHRDLHSFPTRRSSDLLQWLHNHLTLKPPLVVVLSGSRWQADIDRAYALGADLDRKSTRLNSSHTVISYAVFCLKKKISCAQ